MDRIKYFSKAVYLAFALSVVFCDAIYPQISPKDKFAFPQLNPIRMPEIEQVTLENGLRLFPDEEELQRLHRQACERYGLTRDTA